MRLVLFDIDGTLLSGGPARESIRQALLRTYGTAGAIETHRFSGKTDGQIARELLSGAGLSDLDIDTGMPMLWYRYLIELETRLRDAPMRALPGVHSLIEALERSRNGVRLGLLTGNIAEGARLKLTSAGLDRYFPIGGFGSDSEIRDELPPIAMRRAAERWGIRFSADDVVVVGDTPLDIACARRHRVRSVAVATGRYAAEALTDADHVLNDLSVTEKVVELLVS